MRTKSWTGRYANRIKNSTFTIDGVDYHVTPNENGGADTLHGGLDGWDYVGLNQVALMTSNKVSSETSPSSPIPKTPLLFPSSTQMARRASRARSSATSRTP